MTASQVLKPTAGRPDYRRANRLWLLLNLLFVAMFALGGALLFNSWRLVQTGGSATGRVVEVVEVHQEGSLYYPIIEYEVDGVTYTYRGRAEAPAAFRQGETVTMRFPRDNPARARPGTFMEMWGAPALLIPYTLVSLIVTNGFFVYRQGRGLPIEVVSWNLRRSKAASGRAATAARKE